MSETALRNVNAELPSERRSGHKKQQQVGTMKVLINGHTNGHANDENQECARAKPSYQKPLREREPAAVVAKLKASFPIASIAPVAPIVNAVPQMEAPAEPLSQDIEYILSEDLMPLPNADSILSVRSHSVLLSSLMALLRALIHWMRSFDLQLFLISSSGHL
jgi:hypothetical protein